MESQPPTTSFWVRTNEPVPEEFEGPFDFDFDAITELGGLRRPAPPIDPAEAETVKMAPERDEAPPAPGCLLEDDPGATLPCGAEIPDLPEPTLAEGPEPPVWGEQVPEPRPALRRESTLRDANADVSGIRPVSTGVRCAIPVTLRMLTGNPRGLVTMLDVDQAIVQTEHALPDQASVWIRLPFAAQAEVVPGRVKCSQRRTPRSPWEAIVKFQIAKSETRHGLVGLVRALKERSRS